MVIYSHRVDSHDDLFTLGAFVGEYSLDGFAVVTYDITPERHLGQPPPASVALSRDDFLALLAMTSPAPLDK